MTVFFHKTLGQYNLCSNEKQWSLCLGYKDLRISERFDEDEEPELDDLLPSDVLCEIKNKKSKYWYSSSKEKDDEIIAKLEALSNEMDITYVKKEIEYKKKEISELEETLIKLRSEVTYE